MAQVVQPKVSGDAAQDSWSFEVTNQTNDQLTRLDNARAAAAALADLPTNATNAQIIARLNEVTRILSVL